MTLVKRAVICAAVLLYEAGLLWWSDGEIQQLQTVIDGLSFGLIFGWLMLLPLLVYGCRTIVFLKYRK